jgi:hypothetical protein
MTVLAILAKLIATLFPSCDLGETDRDPASVLLMAT